MIDDGPRFKLGLYRAVKRFDLDLQRWPSPPERGGDEWGDYWQSRFEETLFRVGLGVRKLVEAAKLSIEAQLEPVTVAFAPLSGPRVPDTRNFHRVDEFYDLTNAKQRREPIIALCHAIVHSFVLVPQFSWSGLDGLRLDNFALASDRGRRQGIYVVEWRRFVDDLVWRVFQDDVVSIHIRRDGNGDEVLLPSSSSDVNDTDLERLLQFYSGLSRSNREAVDRFFGTRASASRSPAVTPPRH